MVSGKVEVETNSELDLSLISKKDRIFRWFSKSDILQALYLEAVGLHLKPSPNIDRYFDELREDFVGGVYQYMAYILMAEPLKEIDQNLGVVSPNRTLSFFMQRYPEAKKIDHHFGLGSLDNVSVPDGLVHRKGPHANHFIGMCEYTLVSRDEKFDDKYTAFIDHREKFPGFFSSDTKLFIVIPRSKEFKPIIQEKEDVEIITTPFNRSEFRTYINYLYENYPSHQDGPTLRNICDRVRLQYSRAEAYHYGPSHSDPIYNDYKKKLGF